MSDDYLATRAELIEEMEFRGKLANKRRGEADALRAQLGEALSIIDDLVYLVNYTDEELLERISVLRSLKQ